MRERKRFYKFILGAWMICLMLFFVAGCGEEYKVTIWDMGETTEVTVTSGQKVEAVLADAGIILGEKDEVTPDSSEKLKEDTEIVIKRYAAVTVVDVDETEYPVELVGGTVSDAIKEAGIILEDGQSPNVEADAYLEDGMTISIVQATSVILTADGETREMYTNSVTIEAFLEEQDITLGEADRVTPELASLIEEGMEIIVQRVEEKEEIVTETIAYSTETQESSSLESGKIETKQTGANGEKEVTYRVTYVDGVEESREIVSENITKEAVNEIIVKGTKKSSGSSSSSSSSSSSGSSSGQSSGGKTVADVQYYDDCDGSGHGVKITTYSDGTTKQEEY